MTAMTETKDPRAMLTASGWCYQITPLHADSMFNYAVAVYRDGRKVATTRTATKWGARSAAKAIRRRHDRRQKMTGETRALR